MHLAIIESRVLCVGELSAVVLLIVIFSVSDVWVIKFYRHATWSQSGRHIGQAESVKAPILWFNAFFESLLPPEQKQCSFVQMLKVTDADIS